LGTLTVTKHETITPELEGLISDLIPQASIMMDDIGGIYKNAMQDVTPIGETNQLHDLTLVESFGELDRYISSEASYFDAVTDGHMVYGPVFSDLQRRWWFWYLNNVLGGEYEVKVGSGNKMAGNDYPSEAMDMADNDVESRVNEFLDFLVGGS
jgi:hypothetical protein